MSERALRSSPLIVMGSVALSTSGLITGAAGLQLVLASYTTFWLTVGLFVLGLGIGSCVLGGVIFKPRLWASFGAVGVSCFSFVFVGLLNLYLLYGLVFTPLVMLAGVVLFFAMVLVGISVPAHIRITRARQELYS